MTCYKWNFQNITCFSQFLWNLKYIFSGSRKKLSLRLLQVTNRAHAPWASHNTSKSNKFNMAAVSVKRAILNVQPLKSVKKNAIWLKIFLYKVFVYWKLKSLNFLMDSVLNYYKNWICIIRIGGSWGQFNKTFTRVISVAIVLASENNSYNGIY